MFMNDLQERKGNMKYRKRKRKGNMKDRKRKRIRKK